MIPNQIRVFDGLRITTEHVEHLQAGIATAVQDLRTIAGLNRVHRGFEVVASGDDSIEVRPGLAFDRVGNRIVSDQPQVLNVEWAPDEAEASVCISYEQVLSGEVEQHPTLVFDSGTISIEGEPRADDADVIVLARLVRTDKDANGFRIEPAVAEPEAQAPEEEPTASAEAGPPPPRHVVLGVAHLGPAANEPSLTQLLGTLVPDGAAVPLAEGPLTLDFEPAGLSCDTVLALELSIRTEAAEAAAAQTRSAVATAHGEASFAAQGDVAQQSLCDSQTFAADGTPGRRTASISEGVLAVVEVPDSTGIEVRITVVRTEGGPLALRCGLAGKGPITQDLIGSLTATEASLSWQATVAWKALRP